MKNINKFPAWDHTEMFQYIKSVMKSKGLELYDITITTFQHESDEDEYFEVYESSFTVDAEDTSKELFEKIINNEKVVKSYKTKKGLIQACINQNINKGVNEYVIFTQI